MPGPGIIALLSRSRRARSGQPVGRPQAHHVEQSSDRAARRLRYRSEPRSVQPDGLRSLHLEFLSRKRLQRQRRDLRMQRCRRYVSPKLDGRRVEADELDDSLVRAEGCSADLAKCLHGASPFAARSCSGRRLVKHPDCTQSIRSLFAECWRRSLNAPRRRTWGQPRCRPFHRPVASMNTPGGPLVSLLTRPITRRASAFC